MWSDIYLFALIRKAIGHSIQILNHNAYARHMFYKGVTERKHPTFSMMV